jgi:hypothetical protein
MMPEMRCKSYCRPESLKADDCLLWSTSETVLGVCYGLRESEMFG